MVDDTPGMGGTAPLMMTSFSETVFDLGHIIETDSATATALNQHDSLREVHTVTRNPLQVWIIQVAVIIITTQLLSLPLKRIRQPRVIAEILGGILLSPSGLGRIPGFTQAVFPSASKPYLALVANIGLVLFMFLIGLEIEGGVIRHNARLSASIALSGMVIPFALGSAFSLALYKEFVDPNTEFTHFLLFIGVAFSITAFPVLCRILTELKLFDTTVGVVVLSAGVANDVVGWTLLAFSMALAKATSGLTALWVLAACVGWAAFLLVPGRRAFYWLAHRTGSMDNGPTMFFMTATVLMMFCSALVTDLIGIHAIFGSFLVGLIIPRKGGLAIALTEKLEDMVSIIFLPLYFTLSGLYTDFSLLNNSITWAYTIGIISIAWVGKFGSCTIAARISGFQWREAMSIGTLMSCKGLIELIVLNVGLSVGILNTRIYSMFVLEALLLTFLTTPVVMLLYPPQYRKRAVIAGPDYDGLVYHEDTSKDVARPCFPAVGQHGWMSRVMVVLDKLEHLPGIIAMTQLFRPLVIGTFLRDPADPDPLEQGGTSPPTLTAAPSPTIQALRLMELSDRTSVTMESSAADSSVHTDTLLSAFKTFCDISDITVSSSISVVPFDNSLSTKVLDHARETLPHIVLVPWLHYHVLTNSSNFPNSFGGQSASRSRVVDASMTNGVDVLPQKEPSPGLHSRFLQGIFAQSNVNVALFVDRGRTEPGYSNQRVILPFFGGPDDRLALSMVVQMCGDPKTTAKILRVSKQNHAVEEREPVEHVYSTVNNSQDATGADVHHEAHDTNSGTSGINKTTRTWSQSNTADDILWHSFTASSSLHPSAKLTALERVEFTEMGSPTSLREVVARVQNEADITVLEKSRAFIVTGRGRRQAVETMFGEPEELLAVEGSIEPGTRETMGDVAMMLMVSSSTAGLIVVQSAGT